MRLLLIVLSLAFPAALLAAPPKILRPTDFEPLTSLPWKESGATSEQIVERIFREPNGNIRYPILEEYFRIMPIKDLERAFDLSLELECSQSPDELVALLLEQWAERDPRGCWERTQQLFGVVGVENSWVGYDRWDRPPIKVQDREAVKRFHIYLSPDALGTFPLGIDRSWLDREERVKVLRAFSDQWFKAFGTWPTSRYRPSNYEEFRKGMAYAFDLSLERPNPLEDPQLMVSLTGFEIGLRRWLKLHPETAVDVLRKAETANNRSSRVIMSQPSQELFMIWAKADLTGMIRWANVLLPDKDPLTSPARGFLMSRVDANTRALWLDEAKSLKSGESETMSLLTEWARWAPQAALDFMVDEKDWDRLSEVAEAAAGGPWISRDTSRFGLQVIKNFPLPEVKPEVYSAWRENWGMLMEYWGEMDAGEAARYGI